MGRKGRKTEANKGMKGEREQCERPGNFKKYLPEER
jgi:hypothetical protein